MQVLKMTFALAGLLVVGRLLPIYYNSEEYNEFVRHETARARSESALKQSLVNTASEYSLPVKESDISIQKADGVLRVTVDYSVPMNWVVYNPELKFHVMTSQVAR